MNKVLFVIASLIASQSASADLADQLGRLVGYTIIDSLTIEKWYDPKKSTSKDAFEGCDYGRVIVFSNSKALTCSSYGYQYSYRPTAVILSNGSSFKMIVEREIYDMTN